MLAIHAAAMTWPSELESLIMAAMSVTEELLLEVDDEVDAATDACACWILLAGAVPESTSRISTKPKLRAGEAGDAGEGVRAMFERSMHTSPHGTSS